MPTDLGLLSGLIRSHMDAGIDGRAVAREVTDALGISDHPCGDDGEHRPAPLAAAFVAALEAAGPLSPRQAAVAADIVLWYPTFWAQHRELCSSASRIRLLLDSMRDYAAEQRSLTFRPYLQTLRVGPDQLRQWARELDGGGFLRAADESGSWRGPIASIKAFRLLALIGDSAGVDGRPSDYHTCGSASFFLLGDADFEGFDMSSCWICPGTGERECGDLCVDLRD